MSIKTWFLTVFRELFLYHYKSLEFRAKVFALIIAPSCDSIKECDAELLKRVAAEIYKDDKHRQGVFLNTVKEYMSLLLRNPATTYNEAVKDINRSVKTNKKLANKINMEYLNRFLKTDISEDRRLLQQRIIEFLEEQSKTV
jgi:site-specific recombinase XerC